MSSAVGFPKIHPRTQIVNRAGAKIRAAVDDAIKELTYSEAMYLLADIMHYTASDSIKVERSDDDTGGNK